MSQTTDMIDEVLAVGEDFDNQMRISSNDTESEEIIRTRGAKLQQIAEKYGFPTDDDMLEVIETEIQFIDDDEDFD